LLTKALQRAGALSVRESIDWKSPIKSDAFCEYRDRAALEALGLSDRLRVPLTAFWPSRGAVWDALGITSDGRPLLVEAKAHIPEAASRGTLATPRSRALIEQSLNAARRYYAPRSRAPWAGEFYQYANRLAHQFWLRKRNGISSSLVFLYFLNAVDMDGPATEEEWRGAERLIHAVLGLPSDLTPYGVHAAFIDATLLTDFGE
jgi:hypothetical protein